MSNSIASRLAIPPHIGEYLAVKHIENLGEPESGLIWHTVKPHSKRRSGDWAGSLRQASGKAERTDWKIKFEKRVYQVSRVVYFLATSIDPGEFEIDHIDRNPLNNNISNLKLVTSQQQKYNRKLPKNNTSGARGVSWEKAKQAWQVQLYVNKKPKNLGLYSCKLEAALVYNDAVMLLYPESYENRVNDVSNLHCACSCCRSSRMLP